jgi:hypothetical protein
MSSTDTNMAFTKMNVYLFWKQKQGINFPPSYVSSHYFNDIDVWFLVRK